MSGKYCREPPIPPLATHTGQPAAVNRQASAAAGRRMISVVLVCCIIVMQLFLINLVRLTRELIITHELICFTNLHAVQTVVNTNLCDKAIITWDTIACPVLSSVMSTGLLLFTYISLLLKQLRLRS